MKLDAEGCDLIRRLTKTPDDVKGFARSCGVSERVIERVLRGENPRESISSLDPEEVRSIRVRMLYCGHTAQQVADDFGITSQQARGIADGRYRTDVAVVGAEARMARRWAELRQDAETLAADYAEGTFSL